MEKTYQLLSGEEIDLGTFGKNGLEHIEALEEYITNCTHHGPVDVLDVHGKALEHLIQFEQEQPEHFEGGIVSNHFYKVIDDMVTRYRYKCFGEEVK